MMNQFNSNFYRGSKEELSPFEMQYRAEASQRLADIQSELSERENNTNFAKNDQNFIKACEEAGVEANVRQASKFRNKKGKAYKVSQGLL